MKVLLLISALAGAAVHGAPTQRAFVSNERGGSVSVIDTGSLVVQETVAVGARPRGLGLSADRSELYVALGAERAIAVLDTRTLKVLRKLPAGEAPDTVVVRADGHLLVLPAGSGPALLLDAESGLTLVEDPARGEAEPTPALAVDAVATSRDGARLYALERDADTVAMIDALTRRVVAQLAIGAAPAAIVIDD